MTCSKPAIAFLLCVFISFSAYSKAIEANAYIVFNDDSKVEGKIIVGSKTDNEVKFKFLDGKKKVTYTPEKVKAYGYEAIIEDSDGRSTKKWIHYERMEMEEAPKIFSDNIVFVEREVLGECSLFSYYVEQRSNYDVPVAQHYYLRTAEGELIKLDENNYTRMLKDFFAGYTAMAEQIGKKQFKYTNILRMVRDYNYWAQNKHEATTYKVSPENFDGHVNN